MKWIDNGSPTESGYYLTVHELGGQYLFKAFWYSVLDSKWVFRYNPDVKLWWDKRFDYYVPCQTQDEVAPLPPGPWME